MINKFFAVTAAATALVAVPTLAAAAPVSNPASSLSLAGHARAGTPAKGKSHLDRAGTIVVGVLAAGVVIGGIIAIAKDDDSDSR